jgi:3-dehydroquinate synthase
MKRTVRVGLEGRGYEVVIGDVLDEAGARIAPLLKRRRRIAVVADAAVEALHGARLQRSLEQAGITPVFVLVPSGEASKSFAELERLLGALLDLELERGDMIAAFGGGVVGDLAGFAAAIYKRGIGYVQIPTTLLAQVDSSVGGKTAIDTAHGKNLVGAFHQPSLVLADLGVLDTLPERELAAGYAEVVKYGLLGDPVLFNWLEENGPAILSRDAGALGLAVALCVERKAEIVAEDERDEGRRALLNLGHTFGHALEAETGFSLLHGEAVALGCALAFRYSASEGHCRHRDPPRVEAVLAQAGLPVHMPPGLSADRLLALMRQDKKAEGGGLTLILVRGVGRAFVATDVDPARLREFLISEGALP